MIQEIQTDTLEALLQRQLDRDWAALFNWAALTTTGLKILGSLLIGWLAFWVLRILLRRVERSIGETPGGTITLQEQRARTIVSLLRSVGIVVIAIIVIFMVLGAIGLNLGPLLAGAGVIGLAVSFGAQSLVKDIISGLFMLFENQFGVGDIIRIEDVAGVVERVTLRVVVLRDVQGVVHIIPNGEIKRISNLTRSFSRAVFEVGVAYREDADHVMNVMREVGREMWEDPEWRPLLVEEITVPGIESFGDSSVNIRIMATTVPLKQWDVARELRRRLKRRFDEEGIEIPFPHRTFYWGEGQLPPALAAAGPDREPPPSQPA